MKRILIVCVSLFAVGAYASSQPVTGSLDVNSNLDNSTGVVGNVVAPNFSIVDNGSTISGASGETVYLQRQAGGYKGFVGQRPFNIVCNASSCTDNGSTQLQIAITPVNGGYKLSGSLNYVNVEATVTDAEISVSAMGGDTFESYDLTRQSNGSYSGEGVAQAYDTFQMDLNATGSLAAALKDPATFIVLLVSPIVLN